MSSAAPSLLPEDLPLAPTPALDWIRAHGAELARYAGQRVAIDPARGVVAVGPTVEAVEAALQTAGVEPEADIVIFPVHAS